MPYHRGMGGDWRELLIIAGLVLALAIIILVRQHALP